MSRRARLAAAAIASAGLAIAAPAAMGEMAVTDFSRDINATWLADAPAPPTPAAVCVIDTGVSVTPDTDGRLAQRTSLVPGETDDGLAPNGHGTTTASLIAAPRNGWGTVGIWPHAQIVSIRADSTQGGNRSGPIWGEYARGIDYCLASAAPVKVINLSLAGIGYRSDLPILLTRIARARELGVSVVAAAGNEGGAVETPAALPGVIAVAALVPGGGELCSFSARAVGVLATTGCSIEAPILNGDLKLWSGTSLAAPQVSALLAALRAYKPTLTAAQAEELLNATAQPGPGGVRRVDAAAAFRAAGLEQLVHDPPPRPPPPPPPPPLPDVRHPRPPMPRLVGRVYERDRVILRFAKLARGQAVVAFGRPTIDYRDLRTVIVYRTGRRQTLVVRMSYPRAPYSRPLRITIPAIGERPPTRRRAGR